VGPGTFGAHSALRSRRPRRRPVWTVSTQVRNVSRPSVRSSVGWTLSRSTTSTRQRWMWSAEFFETDGPQQAGGYSIRCWIGGMAVRPCAMVAQRSSKPGGVRTSLSRPIAKSSIRPAEGLRGAVCGEIDDSGEVGNSYGCCRVLLGCEESGCDQVADEDAGCQALVGGFGSLHGSGEISGPRRRLAPTGSWMIRSLGGASV
jgi:hypothetical protein